MKKLSLVLLLVLPTILFGGVESVTLDSATKVVKNPVVKFGASNTLDATGATLIGFATGGVTSWNGRTGVVVPLSADYTAAQVTNAADTTGSYSNPAWITSLVWSKISSTPTTLAGYGITDAFDGAFSSLTGKPTTLSGYGITDAQPLDSDLTAIAGLSTTSFGRGGLTQADAAAFRSYIGAGASSFSGLYTDLDFTSSNLTSIATRNFSDLQSKPTTLAGYGITDAVPSSRTVNGHALSSNVTVTPTDLSLVIGTNVEAWSANLDAWSALATNAKQNTLTIGDISAVGTDGITVTGGTSAIIGSGVALAQHVADATHSGYLSLSDWAFFNTASSGGVPSTRTLTIGGTALDLSANRAWLANVTDDTQTKAAVMPNTAPSAGQIPVGNAGGTAYAKQSISGSGATISLASTGVMTIGGIANASLSNSTISGVSLGSNLNSLSVDNSSLQLDSGTTYNGSAARTVSVKSGGVTNAMLANSAITLGNTAISLGGTALTFTGLSDPTNPSDVTTKNYVDTQIAAITGTGGTFSGVTSGCGVGWSGSGLVFDVSAGTYSINGVSYTVAASQVTLTAADGTNPRFDDIVVTTSSTSDKVTGTAAANPVIPTVDPATQLYLTAVSVPAGATTPGGVVTTLLYDENVGAATEWNTSTSGGGTWTLASTNNPHTGTKDIEGTSLSSAASFMLQKGSGTLDPSTQNSLVFWIRSKASWANNRSVTIALQNAGVQVGNAVSFQNGSFGFNSSNTTSYQQIVIPVTSFSVAANLINQVKFTVAGSGGSIGFYFDTATFQSGVTGGAQNAMVWRGAWSASTGYIKNDTVTYNGIGYVNLIPVTGSTPTPTNTNWQSFGNPVFRIGFTIDGGGRAITTGKAKGFSTCSVPGKITGYSIAADTGTVTIKTWKVATGTAVPTSSNSISTSGVQLSTGTYVRSTTVSDFTSTTVAANDIFAWNIETISGPTELSFTLEITPQ